MFKTPQNEAVSAHMLQLYHRGIQQDIAFETGQQQPYYMPTSIRLGPVMPAVVDGTARYHSFSGGVMSDDPCCTGCGSGTHCSGGAMVDYSRFVGGQGIKSLNGVEPSKAAGTQSYTTAKLEGQKTGGSIVSQDLAYEMSGAPGFTHGLGIPKHDQEMESLPGVRRVHGGRRRMTEDEKKKWGQMMKEARQKKRGSAKPKETIHIDINSHKNEPNDDEKKTGSALKTNPSDIVSRTGGVKKYQKKTGGALQSINTFTAKSSPVISGKGKTGGKKQWTVEERKAFAEKMKAAKAAKRQK